MSEKTVGLVLIVLGVIVGVLSLLADVIRFGTDPTVFGELQFLGVVIGLLIVLFGVIVQRK